MGGNLFGYFELLTGGDIAIVAYDLAERFQFWHMKLLKRQR